MAPSSETRATLWVILASATLTVMAGAILGPIVPAIQANLGVSESLAGLIITTHGALIVVFSPVAGWVVDRVGPRRPFVGGLLLYGVGGGAGLAVDSFGPLLASRAVLGVGVAFVYTGVTVLIYELYEGARMDRALGLRSSANSVGAVVWPLLGGALGALSWQAPFAVYLVAVPLGLIAAATVPETARRSHDADSDGGSSTAESGTASRLRRGLAGVVSVFRARPGLLGVYLLYFGTNALLYAIIVFYPQLLAELGITASTTISLYLAANGAAGGVSAALYDRLVTRVSRHALVGAALALWVVAFAAATLATSAATAVPAVLAFGLGQGLVFPASFAWVEALAPADRQGQFSSYLASAGYTGQFVSPVLFGPLVPAFGVRGVFAAAGLAAVGGGVALAVALRRRARADSSA
ncbi:MFS permease [Halorubrum sp. DM2]|uniref:MFS transporter n=1 Tax=Halorubrum sp. DM2 TaxID=2527867 RepID=UPI0024B69A07|nr:MFS transporter [Halorubrum sp. DM2]VTT85594.1 MFS permease [Halorubrum sp. DM2]